MTDTRVFIHLPGGLHPQKTPHLFLLYRIIAQVLNRRGLVPVWVHRKDKTLRRDRALRHIIFHDRKRGVGYLNLKPSYLNGFFYLDPSGYSGWSSIADRSFDPDSVDQGKADAFWDWVQSQFVLPRYSKYSTFEIRQNHAPHGPLPAPGYIAVFLQVVGDKVLELAHTSTERMVEETLKNRDGRAVVIKRHPKCRSDSLARQVAAWQDQHASVVQSRRNVHDIIAGAGRVVCINSGTGFEALLHPKPVVLFGRADYHHLATTCFRPRRAGKALSADPPDPALVRRYVLWFLRQNLVAPDLPACDHRLHQIFDRQGWHARTEL